jgi:hypothetical protein
MKDFHDITNVLNAFPSVLSKDCSGAGSTDGTPAIAAWVNNFWGMFQTMLNRAGVTPSGTLEAWGAEVAFSHSSPGETTMRRAAGQFLSALQMIHGSPGELVLWSRSQAPATVGARVLLLQGQTIAVASYPDLCNAVYVGDALNNTAGVPFYLSSDSGGVTRSTTGAYLTLPDARGVTIRGIDTAQARDPLGNSRGGAAGAANGSIELDALQGHQHANYVTSTNSDGTLGIRGAGLYSGGVLATNQDIRLPVTDGGVTYEGKVNAAVRLAVETRMINMATYLGIRY